MMPPVQTRINVDPPRVSDQEEEEDLETDDETEEEVEETEEEEEEEEDGNVRGEIGRASCRERVC